MRNLNDSLSVLLGAIAAIVYAACGGSESHPVDAAAVDAQPDAAASDISWSALWGGAGDDNVIIDVCPDASIGAYASFEGMADFGGGPIASHGAKDGVLIKYAADGIVEWSRHIGGPGDDYASAVALNGDCDIAIVGSFEGTIDVGGENLVAAGGLDAYVAVFRGSDGSLVWARSFGGPLLDALTVVRFAPENQVVVAGAFEETVAFGGAAFVSNGDLDIVLAAFSVLDGSHRWSQAFGGPEKDAARGLAVGSDRVVVTGEVRTGASLGGEVFLTQDADVVVARYSLSGVHQWSRAFGGPSVDQGRDVIVAEDGTILVGGTSSSQMDVDGIALNATAGGSDSFLVAFDAGSGLSRWGMIVGGTGDDTIASITLTNEGSALVAGVATPGTVLDGQAVEVQGPSDMFVAEYALLNGDPLWTRVLGGPSADGGRGVAQTMSTQIVIAGRTNGSIELDRSWQSRGGLDVFLAVLSR